MPEGGNGGRRPSGMLDRAAAARCALRLGSPEVADRALADHSPSYRRLDTAVLEKLVLEDALGLTEDDISHQRGLAYARDLDQARELLGRGRVRARVPAAPDAGRAGAGGRRGRRDDAAEVDLLLPEAALAACCSTRSD